MNASPVIPPVFLPLESTQGTSPVPEGGSELKARTERSKAHLERIRAVMPKGYVQMNMNRAARDE